MNTFDKALYTHSITIDEFIKALQEVGEKNPGLSIVAISRSCEIRPRAPGEAYIQETVYKFVTQEILK